MKRFLSLLLLLAVMTPAHAQLTSGMYLATAELGAVLLDGRYPLTLDEVPGEIEVSTSPTGAITGRAVLLGQPFDITGQIKSRQGYVRVTLSGKLENKKFRLNAKLVGGEFVGTVKLGTVKTPCRFAVTDTAPIRAEYALALTVGANGAISGPGTVVAARQQVVLTVTGRVAKNGVVNLTLKGPKVFLKTKTGSADAAGITAAKWTAQGFGALIKGRNLVLQRKP
jgi:hypothetical protein